MGNDKDFNTDDTQLKYIEAISREAAIRILSELCEDSVLMNRIVKMAKAALSEVDAESVKNSVYRSLNSIQIEDLWENSGKSYGGYQDPTDVAFEMLEDEIYIFKQKMKQYRELGMKLEEKEYCKGIISGILSFAQEGNSAFLEAVPDDPYTIAYDIFEDWKEHNSTEDIDDVQSVYDGYFGD
jgi:hypothetical protein